MIHQQSRNYRQAHNRRLRVFETERQTKVVSFITGDRQGKETRIAADCVDPFTDLLDQIGPTERISLILHTNGGDTLTAWRLTNLVRMFCDEFEVLIPFKAHSAGTLISLGADRIIMTKQATLGAIDPNVTGDLSPQITFGEQQRMVSVSVEHVRGFIEMVKEQRPDNNEAAGQEAVLELSKHIHPLILGQAHKAISQIRFLAQKLLPHQVDDANKIESIIDFLCADSGSHDYTINRREALELGLNVETPDSSLYGLLRQIHLNYRDELKLLEPYGPQSMLATAGQPGSRNYEVPRAYVECSSDKGYKFVSEGIITRTEQTDSSGHTVVDINDQQVYEGWRKQR
ncbi:MAG: serine protease [Chloroflexi bacterium]|nr:serine protease [Chloroflexota bacterium]